ncbi:EEF1A lysine methyltransferase 1-like [Sycon ciliatum]|uniref:EEF1A lysine methyltransferase 1-like n=1 Tax=Sycon ciliatum TaxID=27933 RepID=UPI0020AD286B
MSSDSDDEPQLSAHALEALKEFYTENQASAESNAEQMPSENWQLSQFWYDEETATALAEEAIREAGPSGRIACISCPTTYYKLQSIKPEGCRAVLLEFDERFQQHGEDFVFYDYNKPLELPADAAEQGSFDIVLADPPFLSDECLEKTSQTVKYLSRGKVLLCTGKIMGEAAARLLQVRECQFQPRHSKGLANEFRCFVNYDSQLS